MGRLLERTDRRRPLVKRALAASLFGLVTGALLLSRSDDPFTLTFQIGAALLVGGIAAALGTILLAALRSHQRIARVMAALLIALPVVALAFVTSVAVRNRLLWRSALTQNDWRQDKSRLAELIRREHPDAFRHISEERFQEEVRQLDAQLPTLTDPQIELALVRLVASLQDGHSTLFPFQPATGFRMLPLQIFRFADGWYVTDASPRYHDTVGDRVVRIGTQSIENAYAIVRPFIASDNEWTANDRAPLYLLCPEVLTALGIASGDGRAVIVTLSDETGNDREVRIEAVGLLTYFYWYFRPLQAWKTKPRQAGLPLYRQDVWENYWFRYLEDQHTVYLAFNQVRDQTNETFEQFGSRVLAFCRERGVQRLVIDIRNNSGGDNTIFRDFIGQLRKSSMNARGRLYLIIGRHTFSAAVNFASAMESQTQAILVGEPAGAGPNHYGDPRRYVLPRSKLIVLLASRYHQWGSPADDRRAHEPQIPVSITHQSYFSNTDPVLDAVLRQPLPNP